MWRSGGRVPTTQNQHVQLEISVWRSAVLSQQAVMDILTVDDSVNAVDAFVASAKLVHFALSCRLTSCLIHTCSIFVIETIVVMGLRQVRLMCRLITWNVDIWNHSLVEARYTHVRDNNEHLILTTTLLLS